jgi:3-dehydrosphinganine reductase
VTNIAGAHAIVTGGSSGIGLATAHLLAERGARVSLVAREQERLEVAASAIAEATGRADVAIACADVSDSNGLHAELTRLCDEQGECDILVTAAGSSHPGYFAALDESVFRDQMDVDYFGTLYAIQAVAGPMRARHQGHIVTISSTAALLGVFGYTAYAPAKAAVRSLTETLRAELTHDGVVVACAFPPDTRTPGFDRENELKPEETARISATITPRDAGSVARAIVRGIERDRLVITADVQTAALARAAGLFAPYTRRMFDRTVRKVREQRGTFGA